MACRVVSICVIWLSRDSVRDRGASGSHNQWLQLLEHPLARLVVDQHHCQPPQHSWGKRLLQHDVLSLSSQIQPVRPTQWSQHDPCGFSGSGDTQCGLHSNQPCLAFKSDFFQIPSRFFLDFLSTNLASLDDLLFSDCLILTWVYVCDAITIRLIMAIVWVIVLSKLALTVSHICTEDIL